MALRPIDNAPERPKKQAKLSISTQKQPDPSVNDENIAPPPAEAAVDYIPSDRLQPIEDPESKIQSVVQGLDSKDWVKICEYLNEVRRLSIFHSSLLIPVLEKLMIVVVKAMKNPRSALCKTSIMAASDIFDAFGGKLLDFSTAGAFDQLLLQLLLKASQDKKFVCEEADRALSVLVKAMAPLPLLSKLRGYGSHTNPRVRAKAAVSISNSVLKMNLEEMKEFGLVPLLEMAAALLNDKLPEAREVARRMVVSVHGAIIENEELKEQAWQSFCQTNLPPIHAQSIAKVDLLNRMSVRN